MFENILLWLGHHETMMMLAILVVSLGGTLFVVGNAFAIVYAFGQGIWWGMGVLLIPFFSVVYCGINWQKTAYAGKMIYSGLAILSATYIFISIMALDET